MGGSSDPSPLLPLSTPITGPTNITIHKDRQTYRRMGKEEEEEEYYPLLTNAEKAPFSFLSRTPDHLDHIF